MDANERAFHECQAAQPTKHCQICGKKPYYKALDGLAEPGQVYSYEGIVEFFDMTGWCEYCFEEAMRDPGEDPEPNEVDPFVNDNLEGPGNKP